MELLQALPLNRHYEANINFCDPGLDPPARYTFKVIGEDRIPAADGRLIDTWVMSGDYNDPHGPAQRFLARQTNQVVIREDAALPNGLVQVKTLSSKEAPT